MSHRQSLPNPLQQFSNSSIPPTDTSVSAVRPAQEESLAITIQPAEQQIELNETPTATPSNIAIGVIDTVSVAPDSAPGVAQPAFSLRPGESVNSENNNQLQQTFQQGSVVSVTELQITQSSQQAESVQPLALNDRTQPSSFIQSSPQVGATPSSSSNPISAPDLAPSLPAVGLVEGETEDELRNTPDTSVDFDRESRRQGKRPETVPATASSAGLPYGQANQAGQGAEQGGRGRNMERGRGMGNSLRTPNLSMTGSNTRSPYQPPRGSLTLPSGPRTGRELVTPLSQNLNFSIPATTQMTPSSSTGDSTLPSHNTTALDTGQ